MLARFVSLLRFASMALCLIVGVSFLLFVVNQTSNASAHQQRELSTETELPAASAPTTGAPNTTHAGQSSARKTIDEVARTIESPFASITNSWSSEWLRHSVLLLLSLAVYGFGLSFLARTIRVRI